MSSTPATPASVSTASITPAATPTPEGLPALDYSGHVYNLTAEQTKQLHLFRKKHFAQFASDIQSQAVPEPTAASASWADPAFPAHAEVAFPPRNLRQQSHWFSQHDHPDSLLLRFLRARKWNQKKAEEMMAEAYEWREKIDIFEIINKGESSLNKVVLEKSIGFVKGQDRYGRPVVRTITKLHSQKDMNETESLRFLVTFIENCRLFLRHPHEKMTIIFDLTDFGLKNMDTPFVNMLIKCLERYYPESLAMFIIYGAPWVFSGIWRMISPLLDPVVASKIKFFNKPAEVQKYIDPIYLPKHMGGTEKTRFKFVWPVEGENDHMTKDVEGRAAAMKHRAEAIRAFEQATIALDAAYTEMYKDDTVDKHGVTVGEPGAKASAELKTKIAELDAAREATIKELQASAEVLDKYVRAVNIYQRVGVLDEHRVSHWEKFDAVGAPVDE
ncbi:CRAL/TRIO domain-containing protein [Ramicandelaber brevisporus]|nr:CRAL/TRIO domain-containing protein [Ramicandelaber brevisporus]